jgi:hypothetical protein
VAWHPPAQHGFLLEAPLGDEGVKVRRPGLLPATSHPVCLPLMTCKGSCFRIAVVALMTASWIIDVSHKSTASLGTSEREIDSRADQLIHVAP